MSLLKRIEQGQGRPPDASQAQRPASLPAQPSSGGGGGGEQALSGLQARRVSAPPTAPQAGTYFDLKTRVQNKLLAELDPSMDITKTDEVRRTILELFEQILSEENIVLRDRNASGCLTRLRLKFWALDHFSRCWKTIRLPKSWSTAPKISM